MIQDAEKINKNIRRMCRKEILQELEAFSEEALSRINYYPDEMRHSSQTFGPEYARLYRIKSLLGVLRSVKPLRMETTMDDINTLKQRFEEAEERCLNAESNFNLSKMRVKRIKHELEIATCLSRKMISDDGDTDGTSS